MTDLAAESDQGEPVIHQGYRFDIEPSPKPVRIEFNGVILADSKRAVVMRETRLPPVIYLLKDDVRMDLLQPTRLHTHCPFKGNASYWSVRVGGRIVENAAWSYEDPFEEAASIQGYIAFYWQKMDAWFEDGIRMREPEPATHAGSNSFVDWLMRKAPHARNAEELTQGFAEMLIAAGLPVWRLRLMLRTLHPQLLASVYTWQADEDELKVSHPTHEVLEERAFQDSPFAPILGGEGGIRRRLNGASPKLDFPILEDLRAEGATDYVAIPLKFSDDQLNIITLVSKGPDGFATEHLGELYEILPMFARVMEVHAMHQTASTLLATYLGRSTAKRVLDGLIKRGDGEDLHAVIWFSDLRDSTRFSETLSRPDYLQLLDDFFDAMAGAVMDHGGEVLKFIGDSVLAIFPIDDPLSKQPTASINAIEAVRDAEQRVAVLNKERQTGGMPQLGYSIAIHRGDLTYGNIGSSGRLDFTVIGPAVNQAARIQDMCKTLGVPVLLSEAFADSFPGKLVPSGEHQLRDVKETQELFTLPAQNAFYSAAE